jgi:hypothetical protein
MCCSLERSKIHFGKFIKKWFNPYKIHFGLPNNTVLLVTMDKFDPNFVFANVKKLKPYLFLEDETHSAEYSTFVNWEGQVDLLMMKKWTMMRRLNP